MTERHDLLRNWIWDFDPSVVLPPFCLEVVMRDGSGFFLHSVLQKDEPSKTMVLRIWDMRALEGDDRDELKAKLRDAHEAVTQEELRSPEKLHPRLDWANLHVRLDDILYCIEWQHRLWPSEEPRSIGFTRLG